MRSQGTSGGRTTEAPIKISKVDAGRRQLETAIELYFREEDPIAIHTLAAAAYEVITTLREKQGTPNEILELVVQERRGEFFQIWNEAQNFFKHADRDADAILEFKPFHTEVLLYLGSHRFGSLDDRTEPMVAFQVWFSLRHPDLLTNPDEKAVFEQAGRRWADMTRSEFRRMIATAGMPT